VTNGTVKDASFKVFKPETVGTSLFWLEDVAPGGSNGAIAGQIMTEHANAELSLAARIVSDAVIVLQRTAHESMSSHGNAAGCGDGRQVDRIAA